MVKPFIIPIFIPHLGCPHQCIFCNQRQITGQTAAVPTQESINHQIRLFLTYNHQKRRPVQIAFFGGNFLGLPKSLIQRLLDATDAFLRSGKVDSIRFSTRPDTINPQSLAIFQDRPVTTIELGAQSMSDKVLALSRRGHTASDTQRAVALLRIKEFEVGLQMMVGLPGESEAEALLSGESIAQLQPDFVRIYPTVVLKNSPLARWYQHGKYQPFALSQSVSIVKQLFLMFQKKHIPVVRMGLQTAADLHQDGSILAGPYHPSFGHLVLSEIMLDRIRAQMPKSSAITDTVHIIIHPKYLSQVQGLHKQNLKILKKEFKLQQISISVDEAVSPDQIQLHAAD
jgi:histone acetyltransferase (RNA polymerase elongator complex component)